MRDYGAVSPRFWVGETGKALRGDPNAQLLALYLMTSPHASMIGIYHCPILYMAHEIGIDLEGASKALARLIEGGFCSYDEASETVFVHQMARFQIGESLKPNDKRVAGLEKELGKVTQVAFRERFFEIYAERFCLPKPPQDASPYEAPPKPLGSQDKTRQDKTGSGNGADAASPSKNIWDLWIGLAGEGKRSFLGKQIRDFGEDAVMDAVLKTVTKNPGDPSQYLVGVLREKQPPGPRLADGTNPMQGAL